jgi:uncharacterized protein YjiS (DUF1127 family)
MLRTYSPIAGQIAPRYKSAWPPPRPGRWFVGLSNAVAALRAWRQQNRTRRALAQLLDHELSDIGLSRGQARYESEKMLWWP